MARFQDDDAPPDYVCLSCETDYDVQHHVCPNCGGYSIERIDW
ncbi:hydrogenase maturation nickel metallochaperone HypA [Halorubellus sp. JP-L1]|nr:hydrogenase maturation nickel metallochaperone HypA [Halorubellus sp. JP-L1]